MAITLLENLISTQSKEENNISKIIKIVEITHNTTSYIDAVGADRMLIIKSNYINIKY